MIYFWAKLVYFINEELGSGPKLVKITPIENFPIYQNDLLRGRGLRNIFFYRTSTI